MKNYLIIGGSSGIGAALVDILIDAGHHVYASYHEHPQADREGVHYFKWDAAQEQLDTQFLPPVIDGVVYCPGRIQLKPFHRFKSTDYMADYQLQVIGAATIIKSVLPNLKASNGASIVLFSTVAVQHGFAFHALVSSSKGAVEGLTRALAAELAPLIRVNAIAPSLTNTPLAEKLLNTPDKMARQASLNPMKRVGEAADVAAAAQFLLSDQASWITGQVFPVDGGFSTLK